MGMINQPLTQTYFALRAEATTSRIITALNQVLPTVGMSVNSRPTDIASALQIDMKLAWKVSQLLRADSPAAVLGGLPGRSGFLKLLSGLTRVGVDAEYTDELKLAFDELLSDVNTFAGSKALYESMVLGLGASADLSLAITQRRALIGAMSSIMGIHCRALYALDVIGPRQDSGGFERVSIRSYDGIFRMWEGVPWCLRLPRIGTSGEESAPHTVSGITSTSELDGRLLSQFSGLSGIRILPRSDAHEEFQDFSLSSDGIGPRHAARIVHGVRVSHDSVDDTPVQSFRIDLPSEYCELDLMIHRSWLETGGSISAALFAPGLGCDLGTDDSWRKKLPIDLTSSLETADVSHGAPVGWSLDQHAELVGLATDASGHTRSDYVVKRVSLAYPPLPADIIHGLDVVTD